jgi:hypothetical protein
MDKTGNPSKEAEMPAKGTAEWKGDVPTGTSTGTGAGATEITLEASQVP